jgi:DNA polymerase-3 subunit delta
MAVVRSSEADRFVNNPPAGIFLYFIHGSDAGLVAERAATIAARAVDDPHDPFQLMRLSGDDLAADPLRLVDEANAIPMFGGRKAIQIDVTGRALGPALEPLLKTPPRDCTIILEAGALKRDHALRKLLDRDAAVASIECYPDGPREVAQLIERELTGQGLTIAPDAKELLMSLLGQDRLTTRAEIEKLATYAHGEGQVTAAHVEAIVADASALVLDHAIDGAFRGDFAAIEATTERVFQENADVNFLLGSALRHATALHRSRIAMDQGAGFEGPFYGPRRAAAEQQLRSWDAGRLARMVEVIGEAVGRARREPRLAQPIAVRALWTVALAARGRNDPRRQPD